MHSRVWLLLACRVYEAVTTANCHELIADAYESRTLVWVHALRKCLLCAMANALQAGIDGCAGVCSHVK